jgi:hypothetical protein
MSDSVRSSNEYVLLSIRRLIYPMVKKGGLLFFVQLVRICLCSYVGLLEIRDSYYRSISDIGLLPSKTKWLPIVLNNLWASVAIMHWMLKFKRFFLHWIYGCPKLLEYDRQDVLSRMMLNHFQSSRKYTLTMLLNSNMLRAISLD